MSRPRRKVQPKKYVAEESDEGTLKELEKKANSITGEPSRLPKEASEPTTLNPDSLFVSVPTDSQLLHTRALVKRQTAQVSLLQAEYQKRKKALEESEAKLKTAQQALFETKATIAPIKRVPTEVLGLIFIIHVRDNQQSPWTLMQISKTWRSAAILTRSLWGQILLAPKKWTKAKGSSPLTRFFEGREICSKQEQFTLALKRAGATPLDIKVIVPDLTNLVYPFDEQAMRPRLGSLEVHSGYDDWGSLSRLFLEFDFSELESFTFESLAEGDDLEGISEKVVKEVRRLRSLNVPVTALIQITGCQWWNELEELTIKVYGERGADRGADWLKPALIAATNLTSLSLEDVELATSLAQEPIRIPTLKRLKLFAADPFWPIDCPNLQHLTLDDSGFRGDLADRSIRLPHLVEMVFITFGDGGILRVFDVPSLSKFDFRGGPGKSGNASMFRILWPMTGSPTGTKDPLFKTQPTIVSLRGFEINSKVLSRTIYCQSLLEELSTIAVDITADFFDGLIPVQVETRPKKSQASHSGAVPTWQIGSPALRRLSIDFVGRKTVKDHVALEAGAKTLIATRMRAGAPLDRLAMRFTEAEGWKELVESGVMA